MHEPIEFRIDGVSPSVYHLVGELDMNSATALTAAFASMDGQALEIDLSRLSFVDSTGFRAMLQLRKEHHGVRFVRPSTNVTRLADILGLAGPLGLDEPSTRAQPFRTS